MPDQPTCPNKPFENWTSIVGEYKFIVRTESSRGAESVKKDGASNSSKKEFKPSDDTAILSMEDHLKKPK
jgi:hypothetical protein